LFGTTLEKKMINLLYARDFSCQKKNENNIVGYILSQGLFVTQSTIWHATCMRLGYFVAYKHEAINDNQEY